jgi:hypothetical protein
MTEDVNKIVVEQQRLLEENARYITQMEAVIHNLREIIDHQTDILSGQELWDECPRCHERNRYMKFGFCLTCSACVMDDIRTSMPDNVDDQIEAKKLEDDDEREIERQMLEENSDGP